nr:serine/threonine-protein phosphatase 6 regulatory subunit 3 isoform X1 [Onthophagus taurus]
MFWKYNNASTSQLETILCKENVTLQEVMDAEDIINECKSENKALITFLVKPEIMEELVILTTVDPSVELEETTRFKYPNIACELLTCDVPVLNERLASDKALLGKLYSFLDNEPPLNPLLASFFSKILGVLIAKKSEQNWLSYQFTCLQVLDFLKAKENFITLLLNHLGTSAIMDLTLKLMTQVEGVEMRQNILNWLDSQQIVQSLVGLLDPKVDKERHYNVAQLLCDFVKTARDNQRNSTERNDPDPLLNTLESPDTVSLLLDHILGNEKIESSIVGGIQVLLALLDIHKISIPKYDSQNIYNNSNHDEPNDLEERQKVIQSTTIAIMKRIKDFHNLLLDPPKKLPINTTLGTLDPPLGNTRLQVTKLIAAIVLSNNAELLQELATLGTMEVLLDMFFKFQWNNFLHTQVEACIAAAIGAQCSPEQGDTNALSKHLLVNCKLIERILDAWEENDEQQAQTKGIRRGYMGHLINITNKIVDSSSQTSLGQFLKDNLPEVAERLDTFKDTTLAETIKTQQTLLGGALPNTSNEDSDDYDIQFRQSRAVQQQYAEYQMQQVNSHFIETYGFNDDDFNDGDDTLQTIDHRTSMNFNLSEGDLIQQQELFKQVCAQTINTLGTTDDQFFLERDETFQTVIVKSGGRKDPSYNNSDSDEDISPTSVDPSMDVDPWSSPNPGSEAPSSSPWGELDKTETSNTGWADFSAASFANFESNFENDETKKQSKIEQTDVVPVAETVRENVSGEPQKEKEEEVVVNKDNVNDQVKTISQNDEKDQSSNGGGGGEALKTVEASGDQPKTEAVESEKGSSPLVVIQEGIPMQTGSSEVPKALDKTDANKEGV